MTVLIGLPKPWL